MKLIAVALIIACPLSVFVMNQWLNNFAYRTTIKWWMVVGAGTSSIVIALLTVAYQVIKAAYANPIKRLKNV